VLAEAPRGLLADEHALDDAGQPVAEVRHVLVVAVVPDEVDERRRHHDLPDDRVEQVVERGVGGLDRELELVEVLVEDGDGQREPVGEVPIEAALPDPRLLGDGAERRLQALGREHLACNFDEAE